LPIREPYDGIFVSKACKQLLALTSTPGGGGGFAFGGSESERMNGANCKAIVAFFTDNDNP
jgi:hypothetical protein